MDEIPEHFEMLKAKVSECNQIYIDRQLELERITNNQNSKINHEDGPQGRLNDIIASLKFT